MWQFTLNPLISKLCFERKSSVAPFTSVIWFLSYARHNMQTVKGVRNWSKFIDDASDDPDAIDASDSDDDRLV